jgi:hypothetical protein
MRSAFFRWALNGGHRNAGSDAFGNGWDGLDEFTLQVGSIDKTAPIGKKAAEIHP